MEYKQLTLKTIPEYLKSISEMKKIFSSFDNLLLFRRDVRSNYAKFE